MNWERSKGCSTTCICGVFDSESQNHGTELLFKTIVQENLPENKIRSESAH